MIYPRLALGISNPPLASRKISLPRRYLCAWDRRWLKVMVVNKGERLSCGPGSSVHKLATVEEQHAFGGFFCYNGKAEGLHNKSRHVMETCSLHLPESPISGDVPPELWHLPMHPYLTLPTLLRAVLPRPPSPTSSNSPPPRPSTTRRTLPESTHQACPSTSSSTPIPSSAPSSTVCTPLSLRATQCPPPPPPYTHFPQPSRGRFDLLLQGEQILLHLVTALH